MPVNPTSSTPHQVFKRRVRAVRFPVERPTTEVVRFGGSYRIPTAVDVFFSRWVISLNENAQAQLGTQPGAYEPRLRITDAAGQRLYVSHHLSTTIPIELRERAGQGLQSSRGRSVVVLRISDGATSVWQTGSSDYAPADLVFRSGVTQHLGADRGQYDQTVASVVELWITEAAQIELGSGAGSYPQTVPLVSLRTLTESAGQISGSRGGSYMAWLLELSLGESALARASSSEGVYEQTLDPVLVVALSDLAEAQMASPRGFYFATLLVLNLSDSASAQIQVPGVLLGGDDFQAYAEGDYVSGSLNAGNGFSAAWAQDRALGVSVDLVAGDSDHRLQLGHLVWYVMLGDSFETYPDGDYASESMSGGTGFTGGWKHDAATLLIEGSVINGVPEQRLVLNV